MMRPAKKSKTTAAVVEAAAAAVISDDLLGEIFIHLPSLACLVRAAATCKAWRHLIGTDRRLSLLHPPLLGFFVDIVASELPRFIPAPTRSPYIASADVCHGDLLLKSLPEGGWSVADCHNGRILLSRCNFNSVGMRELAIYDPFVQRFQSVPTDRLSRPGAVDQKSLFLGAGLRTGGDGSFEVVCALSKNDRLHACVFSSSAGAGAGAWRHVPCFDTLSKQLFEFKTFQYLSPMGCLAWGHYSRHSQGNCMAVLHKNTAKFSFVHVPRDMKRFPRSRFTIVGADDDGEEYPDGELRIVEVSGLVLHLWRYRKNSDGTDSWMLEEKASLHAAVNIFRGEREDCDLNGFSATDVHGSNGYVFFRIRKVGLFAVHLKTMQLQRLRFDGKRYAGYICPFTVTAKFLPLGRNDRSQ